MKTYQLSSILGLAAALGGLLVRLKNPDSSWVTVYMVGAAICLITGVFLMPKKERVNEK